KATIYHMIPASRMTPEYFEQRAYFQGVCDSYSNVRREASEASVDAAKARSFPLRYARKMAGYVVRSLKHLRDQTCITDPPAVGAATQAGNATRVSPRAEETAVAVAIRQRAHRAYQAGYEFHQSAVRNSRELLAWVLRPDYWDYRVPQL